VPVNTFLVLALFGSVLFKVAVPLSLGGSRMCRCAVQGPPEPTSLRPGQVLLCASGVVLGAVGRRLRDSSWSDILGGQSVLS
jgi:hypothetical protein